MNEHDEIPEDVVNAEFRFGDVVHRVPVTPERARRFFEGEEAIGIGRGEPMVDGEGWLIEQHGWPEDPAG
jgi:hypothetical protein